MKICPNCHNECFPDTTECTHCNYVFDEVPIPSTANDIPMQEVNLPFEEQVATLENAIHHEDDEQINDVALFVGDNYHDYYKRKWEKVDRGNIMSFNFVALFFPLLWLGYRRMYVPVAILAASYISIDIFLYLIGYEYDTTSSVIKMDIAITVIAFLTFGIFGNAIYKRHTEKKIEKIKYETTSTSSRVKEYKKLGGTRITGIFITTFIMFLLYRGPVQFIPVAYDPIGIVKTTTLEYTDETRNNELFEVNFEAFFNDVFTDGRWIRESEGNREIAYVTYSGQIEAEDSLNFLLLTFEVHKYDYEFELVYYSVNNDEIDYFDEYDVLSHLLYFYDG